MAEDDDAVVELLFDGNGMISRRRAGEDVLIWATTAEVRFEGGKDAV